MSPPGYYTLFTFIITYINQKSRNHKLDFGIQCPEPESNQRHEDFQSSALPTELSGLILVAGIGFEPMTFGLWARRASRLLHPASAIKKALRLVGGEGFEPSKALPADLQSVPFGHSGIHPSWYLNQKPIGGLEPSTCWLQISCSANWAISAKMEPTGLEPVTLCL